VETCITYITPNTLVLINMYEFVLRCSVPKIKGECSPLTLARMYLVTTRCHCPQDQCESLPSLPSLSSPMVPVQFVSDAWCRPSADCGSARLWHPYRRVLPFHMFSILTVKLVSYADLVLII
jgi:hypothetical protein